MFFCKINKFFKNPKLVLYYISKFKIFNIIPDDIYLKIKYWSRTGKRLNLNKPTKYNEKLQWLKLNDRNKEYTKLVDKYEVREYIKKEIGEEYLIPLLGVYNNFEEINFEDLPNEFVLKPNHTSGDVFICKNKNDIDKKYIKKMINRWLKRNYYYLHREWPYKNVKPRIICEKYMVDESGVELKDYKFMCFNGKVKCLFVASNRYGEGVTNIDYYDTNWVKMPFEKVGSPNSNKCIKKPKTFDQMIKFAEKLSNNIPFVRIDFYEINGNLYFGEITFYPDAGMAEFYPNKYDEILGSWIDL